MPDQSREGHFAPWLMVIKVQGRHVKIKKAMVRIEDFDVAADGTFRRAERKPVKSAKDFSKRPAQHVFIVHGKKLLGGGVQELDFTLHVRDDDALLQGIEDPFQKTFFLGQTDQVILHFFRLDPPDTLDKFIDKAGPHGSKLMVDSLARAVL